MKNIKLFYFIFVYLVVLWCVNFFLLPILFPGFYIGGVPEFAQDTLKFHELACGATNSYVVNTNIVIFIIHHFNNLFNLCNVYISGIFGILLVWFSSVLLLTPLSRSVRKRYVIAFLLIISLPSTINWYMFINKEVFILLGFSFLFNFFFGFTKRSAIYQGSLLIIGVGLVLITKFYYFHYLFFFLGITSFLALVEGNSLLLKKSLIALLVVILGSAYGREVGVYDRGDIVTNKSYEYELVYNESNFNTFTSKPLRARSYYLANQNGTSDIDRDVFFSSYLDVVSYLPRLFYLSFFYPLPTLSGSIKDLIIGIQTFIVGLGVYGSFIFCLKRKRFSQYLYPLYVIIGVICISIPNIGSYYRYRDPFLFFILLFGFTEIQLLFSKLKGDHYEK
ncbi:hypothetical protein ABMA70_09370 [Halobacteriovorax sp. XZX-3]|uniref:hypothetical protein n=1 Tax=unclassified Halobacteriovorax TaxID=2639665 RepID=UPI0037139BA0